MTAAHTGAEYVRAITARESDRRARAAFRELVLRLAPPGGTLFDFGAGAGLDARYFAERGFAVLAYDNDPRMCGFLAHHCRDLIAGGRVSLETGDFAEFLARRPPSADRRADVVTANFAPLNLISDLRALFTKFDTLTTPEGRVVASLLSPYHPGDMRYAWWWRNLPRLCRLGQYSVRGASGEIVRRTPANLAAQCAPAFILEQVVRSGSRFMFAVFRRSDSRQTQSRRRAQHLAPPGR
jgi:SAM-dependent methyltransferase